MEPVFRRVSNTSMVKLGSEGHGFNFFCNQIMRLKTLAVWLFTTDVTGPEDRLGLEEDLVQRVGTRLTLAVTVEPQAGLTPPASQLVCISAEN